MSKINSKIFFAVCLILLAGFLLYFFAGKKPPAAPKISEKSASLISTASPASLAPAITPAQNISKLAGPISDFQSRVTKKPFGIYISPSHSPVSPERFTGFHTGADFETTPEEQNIDVPIYAICDGTLAVKKSASGYGGVAVQNCTINNQAVAVIYGHLRLASITANAGDAMTAGKQFAVLGTGYSSETDGERKHLHLGIHMGTSINILGYVQNQADLQNWIDPMTLF